MGVERAAEKMRLYEKLGDLCCIVKAFSAAIKFYGKQVGLNIRHSSITVF